MQKQGGGLYDWEKDESGVGGGGCNLDSPDGRFNGIDDLVQNLQQAVTNEPGHYVVNNDQSQYNDAPVSRGVFDLQVQSILLFH